jgi:peptidoglycan hydrolase-like protein with peptidoglycan-binding domain
MRRILAKHDKGPDVALIQELLNRIMPFEGRFRAPRDVPSLWAQAARRRRGPAAVANPLRAPVTLFSWGYVRSWDDLKYVWAPGALAAARHLGHRSKPSRAQTGAHHRHKSDMVRLKIDGRFGDHTDDAVREYQRHEGLPVDGIVGPAVWESLCPTSVFTLRAQRRVLTYADLRIWTPPSVHHLPLVDPYSSNKPTPAKPTNGSGTTPSTGQSAGSDDNKAALKIEVQGGIQSGDNLWFVLGQLIYVQPVNSDDLLRFLGGHNEWAVGVQLNRPVKGAGATNQYFASLTRADVFKLFRDWVSIDFGVQFYMQLVPDPSQQQAQATPGQKVPTPSVGSQESVTANLDLAKVLKKIGVAHPPDSNFFVQGARQDEYHPGAGPDEQHQGAWTITAAIKVDFDVTDLFRRHHK